MKKRNKELIAKFFCKFKFPGLYNNFFLKTSNRLRVLCYHQVVDDNSYINKYRDVPGVIDKSLFDQHLFYIQKWHNIISLQEVLDCFRLGKQFPPNSVLITFDDGYRNVYENAFPILKKYQFPAVVFCTGETMMGGAVWCDLLLDIIMRSSVEEFEFEGNLFKLNNVFAKNRLFGLIVSSIGKIDSKKRNMKINEISEQLKVGLSKNLDLYLTKTRILEMQKHNICFGAHTMGHPLLGFVKNKEELKKELIGSIEMVKNITNKQCHSFAYPFGDDGSYSKECIEILKSAGVKVAFTTYRGANDLAADPFTLRRFIVQKDSKYFFQLQLSGVLDG